jgi:hypothetical protein
MHIATHIYHPLRSELDHLTKEVLVRAFAWGVDDERGLVGGEVWDGGEDVRGVARAEVICGGFLVGSFEDEERRCELSSAFRVAAAMLSALNSIPATTSKLLASDKANSPAPQYASTRCVSLGSSLSSAEGVVDDDDNDDDTGELRRASRT